MNPCSETLFDGLYIIYLFEKGQTEFNVRSGDFCSHDHVTKIKPTILGWGLSTRIIMVKSNDIKVKNM